VAGLGVREEVSSTNPYSTWGDCRITNTQMLLTLHQVAQELDQGVKSCCRQPPGAGVTSEGDKRQGLQHAIAEAATLLTAGVLLA
jgi:hypothetical protein